MTNDCQTPPSKGPCYLENELTRLNEKLIELTGKLSALENRVSEIVSKIVGSHMQHFAASVSQGTEAMQNFQADVKDILQGLSDTVGKASEELNKVSEAVAARRAKRKGGT